MLAARRQSGDRHPLDHGERIALHEDTVLERAGLGFVGVAYEVVRSRGRACYGLPLASGRKRGATAAEQLRVRDLANDAFGPKLNRPPECGVPACRAVAVEALGVDHADASQQVQLRPRLREPRRLVSRPFRAVENPEHRAGLGGRDAPLRVPHPRAFDHHRRRPIAQTQARAPVPGRPVVRARRAGRPERRFQRCAQLVRAGAFAGHVVTHVNRQRRALVSREPVVEGHDAVGVGGRHCEPAARILHRPAADPADAILQGVQHREQKVAPRAGLAASPRQMVVLRGPRPALPQRCRRAEDGVDGLDLLGGGRPTRGPDLHA